MDKTDSAIRVLEMVSLDTEKDIKELEGKPFTGKNVAEMFGKQGAMIDALAKIIKEHFKGQI